MRIHIWDALTKHQGHATAAVANRSVILPGCKFSRNQVDRDTSLAMRMPLALQRMSLRGRNYSAPHTCQDALGCKPCALEYQQQVPQHELGTQGGPPLAQGTGKHHVVQWHIQEQNIGRVKLALEVLHNSVVQHRWVAQHMWEALHMLAVLRRMVVVVPHAWMQAAGDHSRN
jgi:hypothetical protein